ncbi:peptidase M24 [Endozoicomonas sp. OPT23]|uniref:aminopeptidase P family protein n=1 Tax=Endozoicomonas sp. OPT23 TaxID=2072845 RepID=UPI00129BC759|nr:aminopeptidase P family protein [Endozoicomonas sp. OPT23]MRI33245.1 peptidase M24 [Endozoicomonas sp. OPT23]
MMTTTEKLTALQSAMKSQDIHAWIIPGSDPHESEYTAEHWSGRGWLSGFSGSAGTVVILQEQAALWTDGRYFLQAEQELAGTGIELMKDGESGVPSISKWLVESLEEGQTVGFDGKVMTLAKTRDLSNKLSAKKLQLKTDQDLLNAAWTDRPAMPAAPVFLHTDEMAGKTREEKLAEVREKMTETGAAHTLVTALDSIAWLFNLRGADIECNPVFLAYGLVSANKVQLFVDSSRIEAPALAALNSSNIELMPYDAIADHLKTLDQTSLLIDPQTTNNWLIEAIPASVNTIEKACPTKHLKAVKNSVEISRMADCHRRDGAAIVRFMRWLEENIGIGKVDEVNLDLKLEAFRAESPEFKGPSFPTIAGYAAHGAIIHYRASEESAFTVKQKGLLLVDSGAQYPDGTTDITRTFACGEMTDEEMKDYTLVLKCHINMARARFLKGTRGLQLDMLARQPAWQEAQNYNHGTGHGVGYFLNVHEGPQSVSPRWTDEPLKPGMLITNEPGMYRNGKHGIRIENIMLVEEDITSDFGEFYRLRDLTLAPVDTRPLVMGMLNAEEVQWLNDYHAKVLKELSGELKGDDLEWLKKATVAI